MKEYSQKNFGVVLADVMIQLAAFIYIMFSLVAMLPHKNEDSDTMAGKLCAELYWDNNRDVDLDLWGQGPGDIQVGFHRQHGRDLDLMRDVLGWTNNPEHVNMEIMCAHQMRPGMYTFDVNYYSDHEAKNPPDSLHDPSIEAKMIVRIIDKSGNKFERILKWKFTQVQEDKTMINFIIDKNGDIEEKSVNSENRYIGHVPDEGKGPTPQGIP